MPTMFNRNRGRPPSTSGIETTPGLTELNGQTSNKTDLGQLEADGYSDLSYKLGHMFSVDRSVLSQVKHIQVVNQVTQISVDRSVVL